MTRTAVRISLFVLLLSITPATAAFAQASPDQSAPTTTGQTVASTVQVEDSSAAETRGKLQEILRRYPPEISRVLKLDPSLLSNDSYMETYPSLRTFVAQHPEIRRNPGYFLENVFVPSDGPQSAMIDAWENTMGGLAGLFVFCVITMTVVWFIRTYVEQRRWNRLAGVQHEVHSKILDRFSSSEDLLAYIQSPSGRKFLEAAPIPVDASSKSMSAPINRIFWSLQAGLVASTLGLGLQFVSGHVPTEMSTPLFVMGIVALSIGVGFVLSAIVSFVLSRKLGLWTPPESKSEQASLTA